jgi:dolichol-phosphate mannosyltransferase
MDHFPLRALIVIPTYNEKDNIALLLEALTKTLPEIEIVVVDDNSPDGTLVEVQKFAEQNLKIHFISRPEKIGLGPAYLEGFRWAIEKKYDVIVQMDADFSHRPVDLVKMLDQLSDPSLAADAVSGSRYIAGGVIRNWSWYRRGVSRGGNWYACRFLGTQIYDWTSGFVAWKREALLKAGLSSMQAKGYGFQIELKQKALLAGIHILEVPILFEDIRRGESKMNFKIAFEALCQVARLGLTSSKK